MEERKVPEAIFYVPAFNGKPCPKVLALQALYTAVFCFGVTKVFSRSCGYPAWKDMMRLGYGLDPA